MNTLTAMLLIATAVLTTLDASHAQSSCKVCADQQKACMKNYGGPTCKTEYQMCMKSCGKKS